MVDVHGLADRELAEWVAAVRAAPEPQLSEQDLSAVREAAVARARSRPAGPDMHAVDDLTTASGLRLRRHRPRADTDRTVLYLHGGGFVLGDLDTYDALCRRLAAIADATVVSVHYRRAPEHPAPAAIDDAVETYRWLLDQHPHGPAHRIAIAGDSAGGALALLAASAIVQEGAPLDALLLLYPNADMTLARASITSKGTGWGLEAADLAWFVAQWIPDPRDRRSPRFDPLHAEVGGLPPTIVVTAEHDPLRDEGIDLALRLREAGVAVAHLDEPGLVHGFVGLAHRSPAADRATRHAFTLLGDALGKR